MKRLNNYFLISFLFLLNSFSAYASQVDTVNVFSNAMQKNIKAVVIKPESYKTKTLATLYLLHGYSGNYTNWVEKVPYLKTLVDRYNFIVVCPDGGFGSWYWDIENDRNYQYETFVTDELMSYIEKNYNVCKEKSGRGITGLSMGGHGALYLGIKHQNKYSAVGSTSGGVDFTPFPNNWEIAKRLGEYAENKELWESKTAINQLYLIKPNSIKLFIDCGTEDFFYGVNQKLHEKLTYLNIPHQYLTMPGKHNWDYWSQSIAYQMAFFDQHFRN